MNNYVEALAVGADGSLFAGGWFTSAGDVAANHVARWNGSAWQDLGSGINSNVNALAVGTDGTLYAGGDFTTAGGVAANHVARWNGSTWQSLGSGMNSEVLSLAVGADGSLYAGGRFTFAGGVGANHVTRWNGSTWQSLGSGMIHDVTSLAIGADGSLYAGEGSTGGAGAHVARWSGSTWQRLGSGMNYDVTSLALGADGSLYAGGFFTIAGGAGANLVARWNGSTWQGLGLGLYGVVRSLVVGPDGTLYAGGFIAIASGVVTNNVARWNGSSWRSLGSSMNSNVNALAVATDGSLYAGGNFTSAGGVAANHVSRWTGSSWQSLGSGMDNQVNALAIGADGSLYAGGLFATAGGVVTNNVARWNGSFWQSLGSGMDNQVNALAIGADGSLYAGGFFAIAGGVAANNVARWNGSSWQNLGSGMNSFVNALAIGADGSVYAGGDFMSAGDEAANHVARWNGSAWQSLGSGIDSNVNALAIGADGSLYAGGAFTSAGGVAANDVARWNGSSWQNLGSGTNPWVHALAIGADGSLFVGGWFTAAGGVAANHVAHWDGSAWQNLGSGMNSEVSALAVGANGSLYAGGDFTIAGGKLAAHIAKWSGETIPPTATPLPTRTATQRPQVGMSMSTYLGSSPVSSLKAGDTAGIRIQFQRSDGNDMANTSLRVALRNAGGVTVAEINQGNLAIPPTGMDWRQNMIIPSSLPAGNYNLVATILREGKYRFVPKEISLAVTVQDVVPKEDKKVAVYVHGWQGLSIEGNYDKDERHWCEGAAPTGGLVAWDEAPDKYVFKPRVKALHDSGYSVYFANYNTGPAHTDTIETNAGCLAKQIAAVKLKTGASRVSLVAHSMGGLVSREYIEGKEYNDDVNALLTLGTPHDGLLAWNEICYAIKHGLSKSDQLQQCHNDPGFNELQQWWVHSFNLTHRPRPGVEYRFIGGTHKPWWAFPIDWDTVLSPTNDGAISLPSAAGQTTELFNGLGSLALRPFGYEVDQAHDGFGEDSTQRCQRSFFGIDLKERCPVVRPLVRIGRSGSGFWIKVDGRAAAQPVDGVVTVSYRELIDYGFDGSETDFTKCRDIGLDQESAVCDPNEFLDPDREYAISARYSRVAKGAELARGSMFYGKKSMPETQPNQLGSLRSEHLQTMADSGSSIMTSNPTVSYTIQGVHGIVTAGAEAQRSLTLDGNAVGLRLKWSGGVGQLTLRDPNDRLITATNIGVIYPGGAMDLKAVGNQGEARAHIPGLLPGIWKAVIRETSGTAGLSYDIQGEVDSSIALTVDPISSGTAGTHWSLSTKILDGATSITGATGRLGLITSAGEVNAPLIQGADGGYTADLTLPDEPETYPLVINAQGVTATGTLFTREWWGNVTVTTADVRLGGERSVEAQDLNSDGTYDSLRAKARITVSTAAEYVLQVTAFNPDGQEVAHARCQQTWPIGDWLMELDISGEDIQASRLDGPYTIRLDVVRVDPQALAIDNELLGTSAAYKAADFVAAPPPSATPSPQFSPQPTYTAEPTLTPSITPSPSSTPEASATPTPGATVTGTVAAPATAGPSPTPSPQATGQASPTLVATDVPTLVPTATTTMLPMPTLPLPTLTPPSTALSQPSSTTTPTRPTGSRRVYLPVVRKKR